MERIISLSLLAGILIPFLQGCSADASGAAGEDGAGGTSGTGDTGVSGRWSGSGGEAGTSVMAGDSSAGGATSGATLSTGHGSIGGAGVTSGGCIGTSGSASAGGTTAAGGSPSSGGVALGIPDQAGNPLNGIVIVYTAWLSTASGDAAKLMADKTLADNLITWQMPHGGWFKYGKAGYVSPWDGSEPRSDWTGASGVDFHRSIRRDQIATRIT
jgi:hypothetical protein